MNETQAQAQALIEKSQKICCITPKHSGGDGVMAVLAMQQWLVGMGKSVKAVFPGEIPENYNFLAHKEVITPEFSRQGNLVISVAGQENLNYEINAAGEIVLPVDQKDVKMRQEQEKYDLILCFEVSQLSDLGAIYTDQIDFFQQTPLVNIGTDPRNDNYAKFNLVDPSKSSVSEMCYELMKDTEMSADLATTLLTGIIAGSESFLSENTTASAFAVASKLQLLGANQSDIIENLYKKKSLKTLKLWGQIFSRLEFDVNHRIARSTLQKTDFEMLEATPKEIENLTRDILRFVDGSDVFVLFYEFGEVIHAQLRSAQNNIDWSKITQHYTKVPGGVDVEFTGQYLADVEKKIFTSLIAMQTEGLNLEADLSVKFQNCTMQGVEQMVIPDEVKISTPQAPENIPFEAPFQPHENAGNGDWLKKNFPRN